MASRYDTAFEDCAKAIMHVLMDKPCKNIHPSIPYLLLARILLGIRGKTDFARMCSHQEIEISPLRIAYLTNSIRVCRFNLFMIFSRWRSTVFTEILSRLAIS